MKALPGVTLAALLFVSGCSGPPDPTAGDGLKQLDEGSWSPEWAAPDKALLRPGSEYQDEFGTGCTYNFLFVDPVARIYYVGMAGHCTPLSSSETDGIGVRAGLVGYGEIGTVVFDSDSPTMQEQFDVEDQVDFSLIQLDPGINLIASPQMYDQVAPTGYVDCDAVAYGDAYSFHGHGYFYGNNRQTRTRPGRLTKCDVRDFAGIAPLIQGDSGGPVVHDASGVALGIVSRITSGNITAPATMTGPTIPYILRELAKAGYDHLAIATLDGGWYRRQD